MGERNQRVEIMNDFFDFAKSKLKETNHFVYQLPDSSHKIDFEVVDDSRGRYYRIEPIRSMSDGGSNSFGQFKVLTNDAVGLRNAVRESVHQLLFVERADHVMDQECPSLDSLIGDADAKKVIQVPKRETVAKGFER